MINVTIYTKNNSIVGFKSEGHAGYEDIGKDIICAAVSVLVINTANSIEKFTSDEFVEECDDENGMVLFKIKTEYPSKEASLLLRSFQLGIIGIAKEHSEYVCVSFKEV